MSGGDHPKIAVENLAAGYRRALVLDGVSVSVGEGEMVGVIGPNGSGKSTLLKAMGRLIAPKSGGVYLDGAAISGMSGGEVARRVSVLPQAPPAPDDLTTRELVGYGRYPHISWLKRFGERDREIIEKTLETCRLRALADRRVSTLSGGERQKAWIGMALAQSPRVMLLDEPAAFLDISHQLEVMDLVADMNRSLGITVIAVLHDLNLAARYCPRLIAVKDGAIFADGTADEVMRPDILRAVFGIGARVDKDPLTLRPVCYPFRLPD